MTWYKSLKFENANYCVKLHFKEFKEDDHAGIGWNSPAERLYAVVNLLILKTWFLSNSEPDNNRIYLSKLIKSMIVF